MHYLLYIYITLIQLYRYNYAVSHYTLDNSDIKQRYLPTYILFTRLPSYFSYL